MKIKYFKFKIGIINLILAALLVTLAFSDELSESSTDEKDAENLISFNFQDTEIDMVLRFFSEAAGLTFIKGDGVRGKVTVIGSVKLPLNEALDVLSAILEVKGLTMIRSDNVIKVVAQAAATKKRVETRVGRDPEAFKPEDKVVTQIISLEYVAASEIKGILGGMIFSGGSIIANERTNTLVITDIASNIERLIKVLEQLDVEVCEENILIEIIPLEYSDEVELSKILKQVFTRPKTKTKMLQKRGQLSAVPETAVRAIIGEVTIIPDERLHSLIIMTAEPNFEVVKRMIKNLDQESPPSADNIRIFPLQNGKAEEVAAVFNELFANVSDGKKDARPKKAKGTLTAGTVAASKEVLYKEGVGILEGTVKVVADKRTNSLIITTSPQNFSTIQRLLEKLDVRSRQVLIKALIAEITLTDETKFGLEWTYTEPWGGASGSAGQITGTASALWDLSSFISEGFKYSILRGDSRLSVVLQALAKKSEFNILSAPCVLASDNEEAKIKIGESVPVLKDVSYTETSGTVKSYDYKDVNIELTVTPTINKNNDVSLSIHQLINKISGYDSELNAPILATREAQTTVVVQDKQTIIIGGLIRDDKITSLSKVPILGDIPFLGALFRKQHDTIKKTELLVFITPYVIVRPEDADHITEEQTEEAEKIHTRFEKEKIIKEKKARKKSREKQKKMQGG